MKDVTQFNNKKFISPNFNKQNTTEIKFLLNEPKENMNLSFKTEKTSITLIKKLSCTWRDVFEIKLDQSKEFIPGDSIGLIVPNNLQLVDDFFKYCNFKNQPIFIKKNRRFVYEGNLFNFFYKYFDFKAMPKKAFLYFLSKETNNFDLEFLSSKEGEKEYFNILENKMNLLEIFKKYKIKPSLEILIEYGEIIKPRYFSLINKECDNFTIIAGLMKDGHFSNFIVSLHEKYENISFDFLVKENRLLRLKSKEKVLCISAGTGITPFLSFANVNKHIWLIYGCRNKEDDLSILGKFAKKDVAFSSLQKRIFDILEEKIDEVKYYLTNYEVYICASLQLQKKITDFLKKNISENLNEFKIYFDDWS
ncbi:NADPH cytochrome p450 reductase [Tubulinosema ratisbonensis]|uniref:NADPH--hemoprotein reductase n=1 Tax=Tubulinosema ratisbonensis TaxID=291195 RepID=A0A437AMU4_9MICR|nr:NADPH cytochrome p450 reductase [Tubulinosema ratisbonensis]